MVRVVGINFFNNDRIYYFSPGNLKIKERAFVVV